jgi:hypothetical protein
VRHGVNQTLVCGFDQNDRRWRVYLVSCVYRWGDSCCCPRCDHSLATGCRNDTRVSIR